MRNPLPAIIRLLSKFKENPSQVYYDLIIIDDAENKEVVRVILDWILMNTCEIEDLADAINNAFGYPMGEAILTLPREYLEQVEEACKRLNKMLDMLQEKGFKAEAFRKAKDPYLNAIPDLVGV